MRIDSRGSAANTNRQIHDTNSRPAPGCWTRALDVVRTPLLRGTDPVATIAMPARLGNR